MTADDDFASQYRALRIKEGWARADGREDPELGDPGLWSGRVRSVEQAARILSELRSADRKPIIVDVGAGGAWAADLMPWAGVIAVDVIPPAARPGAFVRGDMRRLPLRSQSADGLMFAASLHYARPRPVIAEAARVLRRGGLIVAVDSPIYRDAAAQAAAQARSIAYYRRTGFPELASSYQPINGVELQEALRDAGFAVELWRGEPSLLDRVRRRLGRPFTSMVVARLT